MEMKRTIWHVLICVGLVCLIWGGYFFSVERLDRQIVLVDNDFSWVFQVDNAEVEKGELLLTGFAFELNRDAKGDNFEIVLQELNTDKKYFLKMNYLERNDVNEYFLCEFNYLKSGFNARIKAGKLDLQEREYEVLLRMSGEEKTYRTGVYLADGKLVYTNPQEFVPLVVEGTDLEKIVGQGVLRVYRPDYGMYVYQYNGELYWITDSDFGFDTNGNVNVQYHLDTTQVDKLPEIRLMNQWYWDNISFYFCERELTQWNTGMYRVTMREIPKEYSVEKIWTGYYDKDWIWKESFRPYYVFE